MIHESFNEAAVRDRSLKYIVFFLAIRKGRFMGPYVDSIISDEVMPAATTVVVIGGGIVGTFAALTLAKRGIPVVLCEKGYIACEQSSRNWGWCRQAGRDVREMPLIVQSLQLWRDMNRLKPRSRLRSRRGA